MRVETCTAAGKHTRWLSIVTNHLVQVPAAHDVPTSQLPADAVLPSAAAKLGVAATVDTVAAMKQFQQVGFCILADAIPAEVLPALRASALHTAEQHSGWHTALYPEVTDDVGLKQGRQVDVDMWHVGGVLRFDQSIAPHVSSEPLVSFLADAFGTPSSELLVSYTTLQVNRPGMDFGTGAGNWHSDGHLAQTISYPSPFAELKRPGHINCLFFLSDFTVHNGGTWMVGRGPMA